MTISLFWIVRYRSVGWLACQNFMNDETVRLTEVVHSIRFEKDYQKQTDDADDAMTSL